MKIILRRLTTADENAFRQAHQEFVEPGFHFASSFEASQPFAEWLAHIKDREDPAKVPSGRVPVTFMCGFVGGDVVGRVSIRHGLSDSIREVGGHIGYGTVPRFRQQGYATEMLRQSLAFCRKLGLERVLLTCDEDNVGSRKAIELCGGRFERHCADSGDGVKKRRYWIAL